MTDAEILNGLTQGNEEALRLLQERYESYCHHIAFTLLRENEAACECVDDVWMALWSAKEQPHDLKAYIAKVTRNVALAQIRKQSAQKRSANLILLDELAECIPAPARDEAVDAQHLRWILQCFIEGLKPHERNIFLKRYWYGYTSSEIAKDLRCSEGRIRSALFRIRKKLRTFLNSEGVWT